MSVQSEITRLENAKAAIMAAIEGKGVTVPEATLLDGMAALIESIESGGGGGTKISIGTYTPTGNTSHITVPHMLGVIPTFAFVCVMYGGSKNGLLMLFQSELTLNINHKYSNTIKKGEPLTSDASTEANPYNIKAYGANESNISFGVNISGYDLFGAGNTYQWIVGVTE